MLHSQIVKVAVQPSVHMFQIPDCVCVGVCVSVSL